MPAARKNPIEKRIEILGDFWNDFAEKPEPRLLRWLVKADETAMLEAFFEVQNQESGSELPDLFVRLRTPFEDPARYGFDLASAFCSFYEESRAELSDAGINASWSCPSLPSGASDIAAFVQCCVSFQRHYEGLLFQLVLVLMPDDISDTKGWQSWLHALLKTGLPDTIRLAVVDDAEAPALDELASAAPELVVTVNPNLDLPGAVSEIAAAAGGSGPGAEFRRLFVEMANAAGRNELSKVEQYGKAALEITRREKWSALGVAVHMLLASAYLRGGRVEEALAAYRSAAYDSEVAIQQADPAGAKLLMQSRFGEAAALFTHHQYLEAGQVYQAAIPLAQKAADAFMAVEAWRMAGHCFENAREPEIARQCWWKALEAAEKVEPPVRQNSTLPYVGQGLLRLAGKRGSAEVKQIRQRMEELAGGDWEAKLERRASPS